MWKTSTFYLFCKSSLEVLTCFPYCSYSWLFFKGNSEKKKRQFRLLDLYHSPQINWRASFIRWKLLILFFPLTTRKIKAKLVYTRILLLGLYGSVNQNGLGSGKISRFIHNIHNIVSRNSWHPMKHSRLPAFDLFASVFQPFCMCECI